MKEKEEAKRLEAERRREEMKKQEEELKVIRGCSADEID